MSHSGPLGAKGFTEESTELYVIVDINAKHNKVIEDVFESKGDAVNVANINNWDYWATVISEFDYIHYRNQYYCES